MVHKKMSKLEIHDEIRELERELRYVEGDVATEKKINKRLDFLYGRL